MEDVRFAFRLLRKQALTSALAVLCIGVGVGSVALVASIADTLLLRPLPYPEAQELVTVWEAQQDRGEAQGPSSYPNVQDWRRESRSFEGIGVLRPSEANVSSDGVPERIPVLAASADVFSLLRMSAERGRLFGADEDRPGAEPVVVLSFGYWQDRFGGRAEALGRTIRLNGTEHRIVGVLPQEYDAWYGVSAWTPFGLQEARYANRRSRGGITTVARLRPGVSLDQAQLEMDAVGRRLSELYPEENAGYRVRVAGLRESMFGETSPALMVLAGAVLVVLLLSCANVATLLLAQGVARRREMAVRIALGVQRGRLMRQLVTEGLVLAAAGCAVGVALARLGVVLYRRYAPDDLPALWLDLRIDERVLTAALAATVVAGLLSSLLPAWRLSRTDVNEVLKEGTRSGTPGRGGQRLLRAFAVAEITLALLLVTTAALLIQSFVRLQQVDPGFRNQGAMVFQLPLSQEHPGDAEQRVRTVESVLERLQGLPGVEAVGAASSVPLLDGQSTDRLVVEDRPAVAGREPLASVRAVTPGYFEALGIRSVLGRAFGEEDRAGAPPVAVINQTLARQTWPDQDPLGRRLRASPGGAWLTVVGVVEDVRQSNLYEPIRPEVYRPYAQSAWATVHVVVAGTPGRAPLAAQIREAVAVVDADLPVHRLQTMASAIRRNTWLPRIFGLVVASFAGIALLLAVCGVYAVISHMVAQRSREMGIRLALGATPPRLVSLVLGSVGRLTTIAILVGLVATLAVSRILASLLFGIGATDPRTFVTTALLLVATIAFASFRPVRRVVATDPMCTLRDD